MGYLDTIDTVLAIAALQPVLYKGHRFDLGAGVTAALSASKSVGFEQKRNGRYGTQNPAYRRILQYVVSESRIAEP